MTSNVRLYDGTVRCLDHMDASTYQGLTSDPCTYCPTFPAGSDVSQCGQFEVGPGDQPVRVGVSLDKTNDNLCGMCNTSVADLSAHWQGPDCITDTLPARRPSYPLYGHRDGLRRNDLVTLASALWVLAYHGGTAHQAPITPLAAIVGTPDN